MATSEIRTKGRVSRPMYNIYWVRLKFYRFARVEQLPGFMLLHRRAMALGCVQSFWPGDDLGDIKPQ